MSDSDEKAGVRARVTDGINPAGNELKKISKAAALSDESQNGNFPRVVAHGSGTFAEQILEIAWSNNIKVHYTSIFFCNVGIPYSDLSICVFHVFDR